MMKMTVHARGEMATKLLDAADHLGLGPEVIRSQTDGFKVPVEVHQYLFPSMYESRDEGDSNPVTTLHADASTDPDAGETPAPEGAPADDFAADPADLSEAELEKLTKPDGE